MSHNSDYRDMSVPYSEEELSSVVEILKSLTTFKNDSVSFNNINLNCLFERENEMKTDSGTKCGLSEIFGSSFWRQDPVECMAFNFQSHT